MIFSLIKSDEMDDEVVNIIKKWNCKESSHQKKDNNENYNEEGHNITFSSKTFTRPKKTLAMTPALENEYVESKVFEMFFRQINSSTHITYFFLDKLKYKSSSRRTHYTFRINEKKLAG
jgi:hypothetical protein